MSVSLKMILQVRMALFVNIRSFMDLSQRTQQGECTFLRQGFAGCMISIYISLCRHWVVQTSYLVRKAEIQPPASLELGGQDVSFLLRGCQSLPDPLLLLVAPDVVQLGENENSNADKIHNNEIPIAHSVVRLVVVLVDEIGAYVSELDTHLSAHSGLASDHFEL